MRKTVSRQSRSESPENGRESDNSRTQRHARRVRDNWQYSRRSSRRELKSSSSTDRNSSSGHERQNSGKQWKTPRLDGPTSVIGSMHWSDHYRHVSRRTRRVLTASIDFWLLHVRADQIASDQAVCDTHPG